MNLATYPSRSAKEELHEKTTPGVGMKRALFKLGAYFEIDSRTETEHFSMTGDVEAWSQQPGWNFEFGTVETIATYAGGATWHLD